MSLHVWCLDDTDWVVAESEQDAWEVWDEHYDTLPSYIGVWRQLPDEDELEVYFFENMNETPQTKTCAEWVAEHGRGFLCSTEY